MQIRMLQPGEEMQLARMKWLHCQEDDRDYGEHNLDGADYATFAAECTCPGMRATASAPKMRSWSARSRPNDYSRRWPSVHTACTRTSLSISRISASLPASSEPLRACMAMLRAGVSAAQCTA